MVGTFGPKPSQAKVLDFFSRYPLWKKERLPNSIHVGAIVAVPPSFFIQMILEKAEIIGREIGSHWESCRFDTRSLLSECFTHIPISADICPASSFLWSTGFCRNNTESLFVAA
jgi:hypothetical protein